MISVQVVGKEILSGNPGKFYVFVGTEYGIKQRYLDILKSHYSESVEATSVSDLLSMMRSKHIIPLTPKLYVVRYDDNFLSTLGDSSQSQINNTNIVGTIVCIYEQSKHTNKLDKYLPDLTVSIDKVNPAFVRKYLHSDFPELPDRLIDIAVNSSANYGHAKNMCSSMSNVPVSEIYKLSDEEIAKLLGTASESTESQIRTGVAAKNFNYLVKLVEKFPDAVDNMLYAILSTMLELDKLMDNTFVESDLRQYVKRWTREDVYYMFMHTYSELSKLRSKSSYDSINSIIYLISLLNFSSIPPLEVLN